jgi:hypothetical protein
MATKKLAFGGMSNMRSKVKQMSSMAKRPQAPVRGSQSAPSMEQLNAAKQAMLGNQKGQPQQVGGLGDAMLKSGARPGLGSIAKSGTPKGMPGFAKPYADAMQAQTDARNNAVMQKRMPVNDFLKRGSLGQKQVGGVGAQALTNKSQVEADLRAKAAAAQMATANAPTITKFKGMLPGKPMKKGGMAKGYAAGGMAMVDKEKNPGLAKLPTEVRNKMGYMKKGGMTECKTVAKKEVKSHEKRMHGMAKGGSIDGCAIRGKTKTSMVKMKRGGSC